MDTNLVLSECSFIHGWTRWKEIGQEKSNRTGQASPHCISVIPKKLTFFGQRLSDGQGQVSVLSDIITHQDYLILISVNQFPTNQLVYPKAPWVIHYTAHSASERECCWGSINSKWRLQLTNGTSWPFSYYTFDVVVVTGGRDTQHAQQNDNSGFGIYSWRGSRWLQTSFLRYMGPSQPSDIFVLKSLFRFVAQSFVLLYSMGKSFKGFGLSDF